MKQEKGFVLLLALIALVAITLAGVALMRSVDTGLVIAGNLAFKQATVQAGDAAIEQAIEWLAVQDQETLKNDVAAAGYYATWREACDLTGTKGDQTDDVQWQPGGAAQANCGMMAVAVGSGRLPEGYSGSFVINRMCDNVGGINDTNVYCSAYQGSASGGGSLSTKSGGDYAYRGLTGTAQPYYRITARIVGPRNTESIVQGMVAF